MSKFIKLITSTALLLGIMGGTSQLAQAAGSGYCTGSSTDSFNFNSSGLPAGKNKAGQELLRLGTWGTGHTYSTVCDCANSEAYATYIKAEVPLTPSRSQSGLNYFSLNQYLDVASEVWIQGDRTSYFVTPFSDTLNSLSAAKVPPGGCGSTTTNVPYTTGSKGRLSFYVKKSFVGKVDINTTPILNIYYSKFPNHYAAPAVVISMTGTLEGNQNCIINAGQMITVNFGDMNANKINTQGTSDYPEQTVTAAMTCTNMDATVNLSMSFRGEQNVADPTTLATSNSDIGIRVKNGSGQTITPNQDELPVNFDLLSGNGSATMILKPINTTGNTPSVGPFTATATLNAEMQ